MSRTRAVRPLSRVLLAALAAATVAVAAHAVRPAAKVGAPPLAFEANLGQTAPEVLFLARGSAHTIYLTHDAALLELRRVPAGPAGGGEETRAGAGRSALLTMRLAGADPAARAVGVGELPGKSNYFIGKDPSRWRRDVPTYRRVELAGVYPGIDMAYYAHDRQLEYDFVVGPGRDPAAVRLRLEGAEALRLSPTGDLVVAVDGGELTMRAPVFYQPDGAGRRTLDGGFVLLGRDTVGFRVSRRDPTRPLVIDPAVLSFATYLGGIGEDAGAGIGVDAAGNSYVVGTTSSACFPTLDAIKTRNGGVFVTTDGGATWTAANHGQIGNNITSLAVDPVTTATVYAGSASDGVFKTTDGAANWTNVSTTLTPSRQVLSLAVDPASPATVYAGLRHDGVAKSTDGGLTWTPASAGLPAQSSDATIFTLAIDPSAPQNLYAGSYHGVYRSRDGAANWSASSTGLPDDGDVWALAIDQTNPARLFAALNRQGVWVSTDSGSTWSAANTGLPSSEAVYALAIHPTTPDTLWAGLSYASVYKTTSAGGAWSVSSAGLPTGTYVYSLAVNPANPTKLLAATDRGVYTSGDGGASWTGGQAGLGVTKASAVAFDPSQPTRAYAGTSGSSDVFVTKLNPTGDTILYSTYLGGTWWDYGNAIAVTAGGDATVTGQTNCSDFPTVNPAQGTYGGTVASYGDAFISRLNLAGNGLVYSTFLGGILGDTGLDVAVDGGGAAYVAGLTQGSFPVTAGAYDTSCFGGIYHAFVAKLSSDGGSKAYVTYLCGSGFNGDKATGIAVDGAGNAYVTGQTQSSDFPSLNAFQPAIGGGTCGWPPVTPCYDAFVTKLNPTGSGLVYSSFLGGTATEGGSRIAVDTDGNAYVTGWTSSTNFPTVNPFQGSHPSYDYDAYVAKVDAAGSALVFSTYLGGTGDDSGTGIAVHSDHTVAVAGSTRSVDFPVVQAFQATKGGTTCTSAGWAQPCADAFVTRLTSDGASLLYSSYLGGSQDDLGAGIALDGAGAAYVTGVTQSVDLTTLDAEQAAYAGGKDAFVAKIAEAASACALACTATVPAAALKGAPVSLTAAATPTGCASPVAYHWELGDGTSADVQDTSHAWAAGGTYNWSLKASADGTSCFAGGSIYISTCALSCAAGGEPLSGPPPLDVSFTSAVTTTSCNGAPAYAWSFGDGGTSTQANTSHRYEAPGAFDWSFTVSWDQATCTDTGRVTVQGCELDCSATPSVTAGYLPLEVTFNGTALPTLCSGTPAFSWTFGDGGGSSSEDPAHTYAAVGHYTWTMTTTVEDKTCLKSGAIDVAYRPCDINGDATVNVGDVFYLINTLFAGGPPPLGPADCNASGSTDVGDVFYLINYLFAGGAPPLG